MGFDSAKEARETRYWLRLINEINFSRLETKELLKDIDEIINILTKVIKSSNES